MNFALMMLLALCIDLVLGWPNALFVKIGHPVTWIGALIAICERRLNSGSRRARICKGGAAVVIVLLTAGGLALLFQKLLPQNLIGIAIGGIIAWPFSAARSLHEHVAKVAEPLKANDLNGARKAVSMIVGRDPTQLDQAAIARAATESLAENSSDGVIAPLFWGCLLGLPGLVLYKAINTLDSMIGHRSDRYEAFGKVAARLDDIVNWMPARLTGLGFCCVRPVRTIDAFKTMMRDARKHRSPNAGWPETALAAAINRRLSGPRVYETRVSNEPWLNAGAPDPDGSDLDKALALYRRLIALTALILVLIALI